MSKVLAVMLGAALGGVARYLIGTAIAQRSGDRFPWGTVAVNITGCFLIGVLATVFNQRLPDLHLHWRLFAIVGVLGGYTTFSSFAWETYQAVMDGNPWIGFWNVTLSVVLGYLAVWGGVLVARR
jgi:CrcB protein